MSDTNDTADGPTQLHAQGSEPRQRRAGAQSPAEGLQNTPKALPVAHRQKATRDGVSHNAGWAGGRRLTALRDGNRTGGRTACVNRRMLPFHLKARGRGAHPPPNTTRRQNKAEQPKEEKQGKRGEPRGGGKGAARPGPQDPRRKATAPEKGGAQSGRRKGRPRRGRGEEDERPEGGRKTTRGRGAGPNGPGGAPRTRRRPPRGQRPRRGHEPRPQPHHTGRREPQ